MRIRFDNGRYSAAITGAEGVVCTDDDLTYDECISIGFTQAELDTAEAAPGTWIDCRRDETLPDGVVTDSRRIEQLTAQVDALLEACKSLFPIAETRHREQVFGRDFEEGSFLDEQKRKIEQAQAAIALAEPKA